MLNLNVKSNYSLLSSLLRIDDIIEYNLSLGNEACALCDNNMYGVMEFYKKCVAKNIKPIIGLELILDNYKINIYCKNYNGYKNMIKLCTIQNTRKVLDSDIKDYYADLICILDSKYIDYYKYLKSIFDDIYIGYSTLKQEKIALNYTENIVYFKECLYLNYSDSKYLNYLYLIRDGKTISDEVEYDLLDKQLNESSLIGFNNQGLVNILNIVSKCNLEFPKADLLLPVYKTEDNIEASKYLFELCKVGLKRRLKTVTKEYQDRLSYELNIINKMGFCNYFLVVYDFVKYAKNNGILVGPGRGSAAGSLVAFCLGITEIDPIEYDLLFERFLNPERQGMPDIDTGATRSILKRYCTI